jgi:hypothetical protein
VQGLLISSTSNLKVLGLIIGNTLTWKGHIEMIVPKLSAASFAVRAIKPFVSGDTLMMIHYSYFHSIMNYGLIFWGNSSCSNSIFKLQKRIIRIKMDAGTRDSCRELFKILKVLPLRTQYIVSLVLFVVNNKKHFKINSEIHSINTRNNSNLYKLLSHLYIYQNGPYYYGIKVYNRLLFK